MLDEPFFDIESLFICVYTKVGKYLLFPGAQATKRTAATFSLPYYRSSRYML